MREIPGREKTNFGGTVGDILFATKWCEALRSWKGRGRVVLSCILLFSIHAFLLQKCDKTLRKRNWNRFSVKEKSCTYRRNLSFFKKNLAFLPFPHLICGNVCVVESEIPFPLSPCHKKRREEDAIHVELMPFFLSSRGSHTCNIFPLSCCPHTLSFPLLFRV